MILDMLTIKMFSQACRQKLWGACDDQQKLGAEAIVNYLDLYCGIRVESFFLKIAREKH